MASVEAAHRPQDRLLLAAAAAGDAAEVRRLLEEEGADPTVRQSRTGSSPLHLAAVTNAVAAARVLLRHRAPLEAREVIELGGRTPLHVAIAEGAVDVAEALIEAGADVDATEVSRGKTPLILAAERGHLSVAAMLLTHGCDELKADSEGYNAGFWARAHGHRGFATLPGAPAAAGPSVEELLLAAHRKQLALRAVGCKIATAKGAGGKAASKKGGTAKR